MKLPDAPMRLWEHDAIELNAHILPSSIDHDSIGLTIDLPIGSRRIVNSIIHTSGRILVDIAFSDEVPTIVNYGDYFSIHPFLRRDYHRYFADELKMFVEHPEKLRT